MSDGVRYRERLWVPWHWWLVATGFAVSVLLAVTRVFGWPSGIAVTAVTVAALLALLLGYGGLRVEVDDTGIRAGRSVLEWPWVAQAAALDENASRDRMGPGADARAWLVMRPYLRRVVEVGVDDPADPHPYWLIGSRHPDRLAAAIATRLGDRSPR